MYKNIMLVFLMISSVGLSGEGFSEAEFEKAYESFKENKKRVRDIGHPGVISEDLLPEDRSFIKELMARGFLCSSLGNSYSAYCARVTPGQIIEVETLERQEDNGEYVVLYLVANSRLGVKVEKHLYLSDVKGLPAELSEELEK